MAEDALQDAFISALGNWPEAGVPDNPRAWLVTTARNRAIDRLRREKAFVERSETLRLLEEERRKSAQDGSEDVEGDERLQLIFLCCHPALAQEAQIALTLRTLGGLTTDEIARGFLIHETTMAQRLVRAKRKIRDAGIPFGLPADEHVDARMSSVMTVLYLIFNEGYAARSGRSVTRADLCLEAVRLARILGELKPGSAEVKGLLALMLLHDSRRRARMDEAGVMIALEDQDRTLWDKDQIKLGDTLLREALAMGSPGPYQLQAAISAVHASAPEFCDTDWQQIVGLYDTLYKIAPSPVIKLNAAYAVSMVRGVEEALKRVGELEETGALRHYQPLHATRADLLKRAGRPSEAAKAFRTAIEFSENQAERSFLKQRLQALQKSND